MTSNVFIPTYLYIKQHTITGELYFGKTINDPIKYSGSGIEWKRHLATYGKDCVDTVWYCLFCEEDILTQFALIFSKQQNIVKSDVWLNLQEENGIGGGIGYTHTEAARKKMRAKKIGKPAWNKGRSGVQVAWNKGCRTGARPQHEKEKISTSMSKLQWFTDGKSNIRCLQINQPIGWLHGRTPMKYNEVECPHCGKIGGDNIMSRWHFDNCKLNNK